MIIVPNSDLISAEVVNWSYFNDRRRTEIPVSVAYGTDPGKVIELLLQVASNHPEVSETPPPGAFFIEFGDSSLDFFLRIWTPTETCVRITSELRVGIAQALAEAGIEIPFPQRDLHLRSSAVRLSQTEDST
jgi:small-conductance mechanosensitive channel